MQTARPVAGLGDSQRWSLERVALLLLAVAAMGWGLFDPRLRSAEGLLIGRAAFAFALAAALGLAAAGAGTRAWLTARWAALLVLGQAAALQLIEAGPRVAYQHYRTPGELLSERWALVQLGLLGVQIVACIIGLRRNPTLVPSLERALERNGLTRNRLAVVSVAMFLCSATLSRSPVRFAGELVFAFFVQLVALANVVLAAAALPVEPLEKLRAWLDRLLCPATPDGAAEPGGLDRFAWIGAVWVTVVSAFLALIVYQRHPHVPDEVVYLKHAEYFARGLIVLPLPPAPSAFDVNLMFSSPTEWFSPVPPGWPAVLAIGSFFHVPWLVNPVLAGTNVLLSYMLARELFDRRTARLTVLLLCVSPWHVFMAMNFMTHTLSLTATLVAALLTSRLRRNGGWWRALIAGGAIGVTSLVRPLEGLAVAMLLGLWTLLGPGKRLRIGPAVLLAIGTIAVGSLTFPYNARLTGNARKFPIMAFADKYYAPHSNDMGFGPDRGMGWSGLDPLPGHGPVDVVINDDFNFFSIDVELLGWAVGSILPLALIVFSGRMRRIDKLLVLAVATIAGIHSFYYFSGGPDFGARYWYLAITPCLLLVARALQLPSHLALPSPNDDSVSDGSAHGQTRVLLCAGVLSLATLVAFFPWRSLDKYRHYRGMRPDIRNLAKSVHFGRSLVLIRGDRHPDYASAAIYNPLDLSASVPIYAWDRDDTTRVAVLKAYRDRIVWIVDGPTRTHAGFRVTRGPLQAPELLSETEREIAAHSTTGSTPARTPPRTPPTPTPPKIGAP